MLIDFILTENEYRPIIVCNVGGKETECLIDTGACRFIIDEDYSKGCNLKETKEYSELSGIGGTQGKRPVYEGTMILHGLTSTGNRDVEVHYVPFVSAKGLSREFSVIIPYTFIKYFDTSFMLEDNIRYVRLDCVGFPYSISHKNGIINDVYYIDSEKEQSHMNKQSEFNKLLNSIEKR